MTTSKPPPAPPGGSPQFASGERVGRFTILRKVGVGGMGIVHRARLDGIGGFKKEVVVKVIHPRWMDTEDHVQMFLDEARIAASLNHPNIAQIHEIDQIDGLPYLVIELVDGPSLGALITASEGREAENYARVAQVMSDVCRGLQHAHTAVVDGVHLAVVHRDVTPENILVNQRGAAKLIDFGLAKSRNRLSKKSEVGVVKGRLAYVAPEQLLNEAIDARADLYAVGTCLYLATTGRLPYVQDEIAELIGARISGEFPRPSEIVPDYPPMLEAIVLKALEHSPKDRYRSAKAMVADLDTFVQSSGMSADVAAWIAAAFPEGEVAWAPAQSLSSSSRSLFTPQSGKITEGLSIPDQRVYQSSWAPLAVAVVAFSLAVLAVGVVAMRGGLTLPAAEPAVSGPESMDQAAHAADKAESYLASAEESIAKGQFPLAQQLLDLVTALPQVEPELAIRAARLQVRLDHEIGLARAQQMKNAGDDAGARAALEALLHELPGEARALAMLEALSPPEGEAAAPAPSPRPRSRPSPRPSPAQPRTGVLDARSNTRAEVFVDGRSVGHTPLMGHRLPTGEHRIEFRADGHETITRAIVVAADGTADLKVELARLPGTAEEDDDMLVLDPWE